MPRDYRKTALRGTIPSPQDFRAQATGTGATINASRESGMSRSRKVVDGCDPACQKALPKSYPSPMMAEGAVRTWGDGNGGKHRESRKMVDNAFSDPQKPNTGY